MSDIAGASLSAPNRPALFQRRQYGEGVDSAWSISPLPLLAGYILQQRIVAFSSPVKETRMHFIA
jgi:hypothetical protein